MKKWIFSLALLAVTAVAAAQETNSETGNSQWLTEFSEVCVSGPFNIVFEQISETEAPRIVFDLKGSYTSKFKTEVKDKVLYVTEKFEQNRTSVTEVKIRCHALGKIRISGATVAFSTPLKALMMDVTIGGGAVVTAPFDVTDLKMDVSGKSRLILTGDARYFSLAVSTAKVDALQMEIISCMAEASNKAEVSLNVTERLEAKVSTGARIAYTGNPDIVRTAVAFTGGDIVKTE